MDRYIARARILFGLLLIMTIVVSLLALIVDTAIALRAIVLSGAVATIPALVALIQGLGRRAAWAPSTAELVCVLLIVSGVIRSLVDLTQQRVTIPLEAIGAAIVLAARPPRAEWPNVGPADEWPRRLIVGVFAVTLMIGFLTTPLRFG
jgi:hypothetical protein